VSIRCILLLAGLCPAGFSLLAQPPPPFSHLVVFGDSFSDTGNVRDRTHAQTGGMIDFPGIAFNYGDGRYTNSNATNPSSTVYDGVWHEQLARIFLDLPIAGNSLGGGADYAFGGATTEDGTTNQTVVITPAGDVIIAIDNLGKQIVDYIAPAAVDPSALFLVWGGTNDLLHDYSPTNVSATAARTTALVRRLVKAGAGYIVVGNLLPLGDVPGNSGDPVKIALLDAASANYRVELNADLDGLMNSGNQQGGAPTIYRLDFWKMGLQFFSDPSRYGFTNTVGSAQGNSVNPDEYLFWDGIHPTTAGHYQICKDGF